MADFKLDTSGERWRAVVGYEGLYEVSDFGRVRSISRTVQRGARTVRLQGLLMRLKVNRSGYVYVNVSMGGKGAALLVHRMVAKAFLPNPDSLPIVNHRDCNTEHNAAENLEWCSAEQNMRHAIQNERFGMQRLSVQSVFAIRRAYAEGRALSFIAAEHGIGVRHVWRIGTRRAYAHLIEGIDNVAA